MNFGKLYFLIVLLSIYKVVTCEINTLPVEEDGVFVLNQSNFDNFVDKNEITIVFFFAEWCEYCKSMKEDYHKAAKLLKDNNELKPDKNVKLAKVNAIEQHKLSARFNVEMYPTLKIFRKGKVYEYDGARGNEWGIAKYVQSEASNDWKPPKSRVKKLNEKNFDEWLSKKQFVVVYFFKPAIDNHKRFNRLFEKAARSMVEQGKYNNITCAKIDVTNADGLIKKYEINAFPTVLVFKKGRHFAYQGPMNNEHDIETLIDTVFRSKPIEVNNYNQFYMHVKNPGDIYVLGFFNSEADELFEIFNMFAAKYSQNIKLFYTFKGKDFMKYFKKFPITIPSIIVYYNELTIPKKEGNYKIFKPEKGDTFKELDDFVTKQSIPLVGHLNRNSQKLIYSSLRPLCYVLHDIDIELRNHLAGLRDRIATVAKHFKANTKFVLTNSSSNDNYDILQPYNLLETTKDFSLLCLDEENLAFIYDGEEDIDKVTKFAIDFKEGKLKNFLKSEIPPTPKDNESKQVKIIVGKTFDVIIDKSDWDVFILFANPNSHINSLFEIRIDQLAAIYSSRKNLIFAKIDTSQNDIPKHKRFINSHLPQFYYISADDKNAPILFKYDASKEQSVKNEKFNKFVEENLKARNSKSVDKKDDKKNDKKEQEKLKTEL